jgi:hypothetical protein
MSIEGGCYCGQVRYKVDGEPVRRGQCHCRECQYISGGSPNVVLVIKAEDFSFTKGQPKEFTRPDLDLPVTRSFCSECGTHILTGRKYAPQVVMLKVGTLDDPSLFVKPDSVIWTSEKQAFHHIPEGVPTFEGFPPPPPPA